MKRIALIFITFWLTAAAHGFDTILINQTFLNANIAHFSDYLETDDPNLPIIHIASPTISNHFTPIHGNNLSFNKLSKQTWLTFALSNPTGSPVRLYLKLDAPFINTAELYYGLKDRFGFKSTGTGSSISFDKRPYQMGNYVIPFDVSSGYQQVYLKIEPIYATNIRLSLVDELTLLKDNRSHIQLNTFVLCFILFAAIFTLVNYYQFRQKLAFWTSMLFLGLLLNITSWNGNISWIISFLPFVESKANNAGAFFELFAATQLILTTQSNIENSWLKATTRWISRILLVLTLASFTPFIAFLLPIQIFITPIALVIFGLLWFERRTNSAREYLFLSGLALMTTYSTICILILMGLLSGYGWTLLTMNFIAIGLVFILSWICWLVTHTKNTRVVSEGVNIPDVHWPILRKLNHDMRGPINGVLGMAELLQDTTLSAHQQEYVHTMQTAGFSLLREADQLQNLIRIGLNRLPDSEDEFDLYDIIEDTVQPFSRIAHSKQLELVVDIAPELPTRYRGNAHIISQVLANLLDNSLKYTDQGEVLVQVKPWQNQRIRFSVTDTGPGIANDTKGKLFNFPDSSNVKQQLPKDVHLGLPISKFLVGLLGGQLSLKSELRTGTTFWLDLPLNSTLPKGFDRMESDENALADLRLMVVDDNLTCRKVIEHLALSWSMDVSTMSNGQSALANLHNEFHKGEAIDVLILDQNMPSMTGAELAVRVRQDPGLNQNIVIIMMTGTDTFTTDYGENDLGIEYILSKPISARALRQTLCQSVPTIKQNRDTRNAKNSNSYFF